MNKDEIKKALECCEKYAYCKDCPCYTYCDHELHKDALNLITEQETEIGQLKDEYLNCVKDWIQGKIHKDGEFHPELRDKMVENIDRALGVKDETI